MDELFVLKTASQLAFPGQPRKAEYGSKSLGLKLSQQVSTELMMSDLFEGRPESLEIHIKFRWNWWGVRGRGGGGFRAESCSCSRKGMDISPNHDKLTTETGGL